MQSSEDQPVNHNKRPVRRRDYSLFYFQHDVESGRSYLRFTPLGVTVILLLTIVPLILVLVLYFVNSQASQEIKVNTNIPVHSSTPDPVNRPLIIQRPTSLPQPKIRQQPMTISNPLRDPLIINSNEYPRPNRSPTPQSSNRSVNGG